jgi:hypothetical protein
MRIIIELDAATGAATVSSSATADRGAATLGAQEAPISAGPFSGLPAPVTAPATARGTLTPSITGSPPPPHADTFDLPGNGGRQKA